MWKYDLEGIPAWIARTASFIGVPFLFYLLWNVTGLHREMVIHNLEEIIGSISGRVDFAIEEFETKGTVPPFENLKKQLGRVSKYAKEHPLIVELEAKIRNAETLTPGKGEV